MNELASALPSALIRTETLARFVISKRWVREDRTVQPDAFIPPEDLQLSTTRHHGLTPQELWDVGQAVAAKRGKVLEGRADLSVADVESTGLRAVAAPLIGNANHAHIVGWPEEKPFRKNLAQELAALSTYVPKP